MAAFNKYNDFTRAVLAGTHQFGTHVFKAAFTNTAPNVANTQLSQITQIGTGGGYTGGAGGGLTLDNVTLTTKEAWATYRQALRDITNQPDPFNIVWPTPPGG